MPQATTAKKTRTRKTTKKASKVRRIASHKDDKRRQELAVHIDSIQATRAQGVKFEADAMLQTYKLYRLKSLWRTSPKQTFESEVIKAYKLCTVSRWRAFLKAKKHPNITNKHITTLGLPAICLIMRQEQRRQWKLLQAAVKFRATHGVEPTYQYITQLIGPRKKSDKPTRRELENYIQVLKAEIRKLGGRVPTMERF